MQNTAQPMEKARSRVLGRAKTQAITNQSDIRVRRSKKLHILPSSCIWPNAQLTIPPLTLRRISHLLVHHPQKTINDQLLPEATEEQFLLQAANRKSMYSITHH